MSYPIPMQLQRHSQSRSITILTGQLAEVPEYAEVRVGGDQPALEQLLRQRRRERVRHRACVHLTDKERPRYFVWCALCQTSKTIVLYLIEYKTMINNTYLGVGRYLYDPGVVRPRLEQNLAPAGAASLDVDKSAHRLCPPATVHRHNR